MPVEFHWHDEVKTILVQRFHGSVGIADYRAAVNDNARWLSEVSHRVDLVLDALDARIDWGGLLTAASYADQRVPDNQRFIILITTNRFVHTMVDIARRFAPRANRNQFFATSMPQALELLQRQREIIAMPSSK
jgi:hypothetical protein